MPFEGFENGDTVETINAFSLDSADRALEVYTKIREARNFEIAVTRYHDQVSASREDLAAGVGEPHARDQLGGSQMLLILAIILGVLWLLGFTVFHVASGAIHLLILIAIVVAIVHFVQARRTTL